MRLRIVFAALVFFVTLPLYAPAEVEETLLCSEHLKSGRYDELVGEWLDYVEKNPAAPFSEFVLRAVPSLMDYLKDDSLVVKRLANLGGIAGYNKLLRQRALVTIYVRNGNVKLAEEISRASGVITNWAFSGPWGWTTRTAFDEPFPPEEEFLLKNYQNEGRILKWRRLPDRPSSFPINFSTYTRPYLGATYAVTQVNLPAAQECYLIIYSAGPFKLWLNHTLLAKVNPLRETGSAEHIVPVRLEAGWNNLGMKLLVAGEFQIQIVNKDWQSLNLEFEDELKAHSSPLTTTVFSAVDSPAVSYYKGGAGNHSFRQAILGLLYFYQRDYDKAFSRLEAALKGKPDSPYLAYYLTWIYESSPLFPRAYRATQVQELTDKILRMDERFVPAYLLQAKYYEEQDKIEDALRALSKAFQFNPDFFYGYLYGLTITERQGWDYEYQQFLDKARRLSPNNNLLLSSQASYYWGKGNYEKAREIYRELVKHQPAARRSFINLERQTGRLNKVQEYYETVLSDDPNNPLLIEESAKISVALKDYVAAIKQYEHLHLLVPDEARYLEAIGDLYKRQGEIVQAKEYYQKSLLLNPAHIKLRRYLEYIDKKETDFARDFYIDVAPLVVKSPTQKQFPQARVIYLVDQGIIHIWEDGSHSEVIHQAYKILNEEGVEKYSQVNIDGELIEARVYRSDGVIMEPTLVGGRNLTMPGIQVGSVVEYKYRRDYPKPSFQFVFPKFYFQDPYYDAPLLLTQLIVIAPKGFPLKYLQGNMLAKPKEREKDNLCIYEWTFTDTAYIERESRMPDIDEILPYVQVGENRRTWSELAQYYEDFYYGRTAVTNLIRKTARTVTLGKETIKDKVSSLYYFVDNLIREKGDNQADAQTILLTRKGNRLILLKALLGAMGIENYFVLVRRSPPAPQPDWSYPDPYVFLGEDSAGQLLMVIQEDGSPLWVCGDYRNLLFGDLPSYVQGAKGLVLGKTSSGDCLVTIPQLPPERQSTLMELTLHLSNEAETSGEGVIYLTGLINSSAKETNIKLSQTEQSQQLERFLAGEYPGLVLKESSFNNLDTPTKPLEIKFNFLLPHYVLSSGQELNCRNGLRKLGLTTRYIAEASRKFPLVIEEPFYRNDKVRIYLPQGHQFLWTPPATTITSTAGTYRLDIRPITDAQASDIEIVRTIYIPAQKIPPADYPDFIKFCRAIDHLEERPLRFARRPSGEDFSNGGPAPKPADGEKK